MSTVFVFAKKFFVAKLFSDIVGCIFICVQMTGGKHSNRKSVALDCVAVKMLSLRLSSRSCEYSITGLKSVEQVAVISVLTYNTATSFIGLFHNHDSQTN